MAKMTEMQDDKLDKKLGIKETTKKDSALDKKRGLPADMVLKGTQGTRGAKGGKFK